ncbi:reverse transcriptase [Tanacetum coccineum]
MANRLKPFIHKIISPQQSAFIPGRLIQDSMVIANEAFHYIRNKKKGNQNVMALKIDLNKAFDRVEWDFLMSTLKKMGFGDKWCRWVFSCISSYELEITINGNSIDNVKPSRGIRQGDPISPFLFIIVADVLSKMINDALQRSIIIGINMAREFPVISHIFFTDDSIFFLKANIEECKRLINILEKYCDASGQSINLSKSAAFFSPNTPETTKQDLCTRFHVQIMDPKARYLGMPSIHCRNKSELFSFILERVLNKMQGWKQKLLSDAGREILIKSVIQAIPSYDMQCFLLPTGFLNKILTYVKRFFWGGDAHGSHIHWVGWDRISRPKDEGGLGFRDLKAFNLALLAKQGWRLIVNPHSFWGRVLKGIYFPRSNFITAQKGSHPSWLWQSLLQGRDLLLQGIRWQVGNGSDINFWTSKWVPYPEEFYIRTPRGPFDTSSRVSDFIDNGYWDMSKLKAHISNQEAQFISEIPISRTNIPDKIIWHYESKCNYTVKSGYRLAIKWLNLSTRDTASSSSSPRKLLEYIATIAWNIWKSRNRLVFENTQPCPDQVISTSNIMVHEADSTLSHFSASNPSVLYGLSQESSHK